jgi:hypothetical protein
MIHAVNQYNIDENEPQTHNSGKWDRKPRNEKNNKPFGKMKHRDRFRSQRGKKEIALWE